MISNKRFTIGIAAYNAEAFISEGLESIANQQFDLSKVEVLIVDDCSTDKTIEIIEPYQRTLDLRLIKLPENSGGPGKPRNTVIKEAQGEFILFLDADDYLHPDLLRDAETMIENHQSEVLLFKMKGVNGRGVPKSMFQETAPAVDLVASKIIYTLSPTKMFQTKLLREHNIYFPVDLKSAEDQLFTMQAYLQAKTISVLAEKDYYYLVTREGDHMSAAYVAPDKFYLVMKKIMQAIYESDRENKDSIAAVFVKRHFMHSRTTNFTQKIADHQEKTEWFAQLNDFALQIPTTVDEHLPANLQILLSAGRALDLAAYEDFEYRITNQLFDAFTVKGTQIFGQIQTAHGLGEQNLNAYIKPVISITKFDLDAERLQLEIELGDMIKGLHFQPEILLYDRNKTEQITIPPQKQHGNRTFIFDITFAEHAQLLVQKKIWDFFLTLHFQRFKLTRRIGKVREPYPYSQKTSILTAHAAVQKTIRPYFTENDFLSLQVADAKHISATCQEWRPFKKQCTLQLNGAPYKLNAAVTLQLQDKKFPAVIIQAEESADATVIQLQLNKRCWQKAHPTHIELSPLLRLPIQ